MKLLSDRLKLAMEEKYKRDGAMITPADIARFAKVSDASASYWLNDANGISAAKSRLIAVELGVDALWLETGQGDPFPKTGGKSYIKPHEGSSDALAEALEILKAFEKASPNDRAMILKSARTAAKRALAGDANNPTTADKG